MYDISDVSSAPKVRITMMTEALSRQTHTERIVGGRLARAGASVRWLASGGHRRVRAVYVESTTASAMPTDLAFLLLMRLLRRPVGVYFRDAYQLFRDVHPRARRRQILSDGLWRLTMPLLRAVASVRYAPSNGLAAALHLRRSVLLPPGTDPSLPFLGIGEPDVVGAIVQIAPRSGFDLLLAAMEIVRGSHPDARLRIVARSADGERAAQLPKWVEVTAGGRASIADALAQARVCVLPLPVNDYTNLAVAVRLFDLMAWGKPIVATDTRETRALLAASGAGTVAAESPEAMAASILALLDDEAAARRCSDSARAWAGSPANTWDARAATVLETLRVAPEPAA
jgi:glycosyltransferase involved in cell wall biosynthesis